MFVCLTCSTYIHACLRLLFAQSIIDNHEATWKDAIHIKGCYFLIQSASHSNSNFNLKEATIRRDNSKWALIWSINSN